MWTRILDYLATHRTEVLWFNVLFQATCYCGNNIAPLIAPDKFPSQKLSIVIPETVTLGSWVTAAFMQQWNANRYLLDMLSYAVVAGGTLNASQLMYGDAAAARGFMQRCIFGRWDAAAWRRIKARHTYNQVLTLHTTLAAELNSSKNADMDPEWKRLQLCISNVDLSRARLRMHDADLTVYASDGTKNLGYGNACLRSVGSFYMELQNLVDKYDAPRKRNLTQQGVEPVVDEAA